MSGGIEIPGLASWLSDPSTGTSTVIQGHDMPTSKWFLPLASVAGIAAILAMEAG